MESVSWENCTAISIHLWTERQELHHKDEVVRRWCSQTCGTLLLLNYSASEPLRRAIFDTNSSFFDLWFRLWAVRVVPRHYQIIR